MGRLNGPLYFSKMYGKDIRICRVDWRQQAAHRMLISPFWSIFKITKIITNYYLAITVAFD